MRQEVRSGDVSLACCPSCRLLQRPGACAHCGEATTDLDSLTRERIEGLTTVRTSPPSGIRNVLALFATAFGVFGAGAAGVLLTHSPLGLFAGPAAGAFGYRKQFWRAALKRRPRLQAVPRLVHPDGEPVFGEVQPFQQTLAPNTLAVATSVETNQGVIVRAIEAVPFWVALADKRVLVTGTCWVSSGTPVTTDRVTDTLRALGARDLPISRSGRRKMRVATVTIAPGDRVSIIGALREEQLPGGGGYRDALVECMRGEPGAPVWIDRLDGNTAAPSRVVAPARRHPSDAGA